jgi:hypothetical protein
MDQNRVTTLYSSETVPAAFYEQMRERAIRWSETHLARLAQAGCARQTAVNQVLREVTQHWGPECAHEVEQALTIRYQNRN